MSSAQIVSVPEEQCQPLSSSRSILHRGVSEGPTDDLSNTIDARNCTFVIISSVVPNGAALDPNATHSVTVLADGGDNFDTFATIDGPRLDGDNDLEALTN